MSMITRFFAKSAVITSDMIRKEIERAESETVTLHSKLAAARSGVMFMSDSEHRAVEAGGAATERAITRMDARISHLQSELPAVFFAAEEAAQAVAKDEALRKRANECRKANAKEAKVLLASYAQHANAIGDVIARLKEITDETNTLNQALHRNPVADSVVSYDTLHRKHPDRSATERISFRAGRYEDSLETAVHLPPAFVRGPWAWRWPEMMRSTH
jgi:hypothetical protein